MFEKLTELKLLDKLRFRDLLAISAVMAILYSLTNIDLDGVVMGAMISALTLILQFYFRKNNKKSEKPVEISNTYEAK